eukprot:798572-Lingulodinium_polyedra.AAC.1
MQQVALLPPCSRTLVTAEAAVAASDGPADRADGVAMSPIGTPAGLAKADPDVAPAPRAEKGVAGAGPNATPDEG